MFYKYLFLFIAVLAAPVAEARNFYQIEETLDLSYTNISDGTKILFTRLPVEIRVSDDKVFCQVKISGFVGKCLVSDRYRENDQPMGFYIALEGPVWLGIFQALSTDGHVDPIYSRKLERIHRNLEGKIPFWIREGQDEQDYPASFQKQFDDNAEPEAFHFTFTEEKTPKQI